jgi:hypothetical protein
MTDDLLKAMQRMRTARYAKAEQALKDHGIEERTDFPHGLRLLVDSRFPNHMIGIFTDTDELVLDLRNPDLT